MVDKEPIRGCGTRVPGGVYATTPTSPWGREVEEFLVDPPRPVDPDGLGLSHIGVKLIRDAKGVTHVLDWVGKKHYPNVADFVEEVRAIGMSRRLPKSLNFALLSQESKIILVHDRAWIQNAHDYYVAEAGVEVGRFTACPKHLDAHKPDRALDMCARLFWQDVDDPVAAEWAEEGSRRIERELPAVDYDALLPPEGVKPEYRPAIFASFPIVRLQVIRAEDDAHQGALKAASAARIGIDIEDF